MTNISARYNAGHFFLSLAALLYLGISSGCGTNTPLTGELDVGAGDISVLIRFQNLQTENSMPGAVRQLPSTAAGLFLPPMKSQPDFFYSIATEADSAGKLLILILPEGESFHGSRDHLVIQINSNGIPVAVEPGIDSELLSDSLWSDPVQRQKTVLELIHFLKPDMILQVIPDAGNSADVVRCWQEQSAEESITVSLYELPAEDGSCRGWGAFTGRGIENRLLEGMDVQGFATTVELISGLRWNRPDYGYPAMQAFYPVETE